MEKFFVGVQVTVLGMVTVVVILLLLYLAMVVLYRAVGPKEKAPQEKEPAASPPVVKEPSAHESQKVHDPKVVAAITAAVLAACDADAQPGARALRLSRSHGRQWKAWGRAKAVAGLRRQ